MRDADRAAFGAMLQAVADLYGRDLSADVVRLYWHALAAYDLAAVRQAFDRHVKSPDSGQFMPKPADLIRALGGTSADAAMQAWARVERAIRTVGGHESVAFDDALIHRCIDDMGGWPKVCTTREDELPFRARDFQTLYRGFVLRREVPAYPTHLIGRFEAQNRAAGQPVAAPLLIGDPVAARRVMEGGGDTTLRLSRAADAAAAVAPRLSVAAE